MNFVSEAASFVCEPDSDISLIERASRSERLRIDNKYIVLQTDDVDITGFKFLKRGGKAVNAIADVVGGLATASFPLTQLIANSGTYDIFVQRTNGENYRFGKSLIAELQEDSERLIGTVSVQNDRGTVFVSPYITYARRALSLLISPTDAVVSDHVFGLLFANLTQIALNGNILKVSGEFLISGAKSADCNVSIVMKCAEAKEELVSHCKLALRQDLHNKYAFGSSDYRRSGFKVAINIDSLAAKGIVTGRRVAFYIRIKHDGRVYEKRVKGLPEATTKNTGKIKNCVEVHLEEHRGSGYLYLAYNKKYTIDFLEIEEITRTTPGTFGLKGCFAVFGIDSKLLTASIVAVQRHIGGEYRHSVKRHTDAALSSALFSSDANYDTGAFSSKINVKKMSQTCFSGDRFVDFYLEVRLFDMVLRRRINVTTPRYEEFSGEYLQVYKRLLHTNDVVVYLTRGTSFLSMSLRESLKEDDLTSIIKERFALFLDRILPKTRENHWLTYETYSATAQDNSFYFFKWMMENIQTQKVYYVIRRESKDLEFLRPYMSNVLYYYSLKHLLSMLRCSLFVSAQGRFHAYKFRPIKSEFKRRVMNKKFVFLQHGVTAFKKSTFRRSDPSGGANLVMAVSNAEKGRIMKHWGYKSDEVIVAGFSRFDELNDKSSREHPVVLVMPTWRSWLEDVSQESFDASEFSQQYRELLAQLEKRVDGAEIKFYIHIKLAKYVNHWVNDFKKVRIVLLGEARVNDMLMEASVLITDYSSVAWDFLYMSKPTVFFQFDFDTYKKFTGSFIDLKKGLFGPSSADAGTAVDLVQSALSGGIEAQSKVHFGNVDKDNSLRIYRSIIARFGR